MQNHPRPTLQSSEAQLFPLPSPRRSPSDSGIVTRCLAQLFLAPMRRPPFLTNLRRFPRYPQTLAIKEDARWVALSSPTVSHTHSHTRKESIPTHPCLSLERAQTLALLVPAKQPNTPSSVRDIPHDHQSVHSVAYPPTKRLEGLEQTRHERRTGS